MPDTSLLKLPSSQPFLQQTPIELDDTSSLLDVAEQLVDGFIGGFTTFNVGEQPKDEWGEMARSLGHLAGFIGFIPGMGSLGSLAAKGFTKAARMELLKGGATAAKLTALAPKVGQFKSVPMLGADLITTGLEKLGAGKAAKLAGDYLVGKGVTEATVESVQYALEGGLHLGLASGVSSWQQGTDAMFNSFVQGAVAGGVFRGLGQALPNAPGRTPTGNVINNFKQILIDPMTGKLSPDSHGMLRVLASSMFTGLPATLQGESTPLQIYEYLLGGVFGAGEMSKSDRDAHNWITNEAFAITKGTRLPIQMGQMALLSPENIESFHTLTPKVQDIVKANLQMRGFGLKNLVFQINGSTYETESSIGGLQLAKWVNESLPKAYLKLLSAHSNREITDAEYDKQMGYLHKALGTAKLNVYFEEAAKQYLEEGKTINDLPDETKQKIWDTAAKRLSQDILDQILIERTNDQDAAFIMERHKYEPVEGKVHTQYTEIMNEVKENFPSFKNPIELIGNEFYRESIRKKHITETSQTSRVEHVIKVANTIDEVFKKGDVTFDKLRVAVEKTTGLEITMPKIVEGTVVDNSLWRDLRRAYKYNQRTLVKSSEIVYSKNGKSHQIVELKNVNSKNQRIAQFKHRHFIEEVLGKDVYFSNLKQIKFQGEDYDLHDMKDMRFADKIKNAVFNRAKKITPANMIYQLHSDPTGPKTLFIGAKDNSNVFIVGFLEGARDVKEAEATLKQVDALLKSTESEASVKEYRDFLEQQIKTFVTDSGARSRGINSIKLSSIIFKQNYANNLLIMAKLNGMSLEDYITKSRAKDANGKSLYDFITSPTALNKRGSLLNNGFDRVDPEYFKDITDIKDNNLKIVFFDEMSSTRNTVGKKDIKKHIDGKDGAEEILASAHVDGFFKLRDDIYERLSLQAGLELETGSQKGSLVHVAEDGQGLVLGKFAYHKASKAESDAMRAKGIHGLMPKSAAKQVGTRELATVQWHPIKNTWNIKGKAYDIPLESFTTTEGGEHAGLTLKDKAMLSQMMSGLQTGKHDAARQELNDIANNKFKGSPEENDKALQYLSNEASVNPDTIDIEKLGSQTILDILNSGKSNKLYRRLLGEISDVLANREYEEDIFNSADKQAEIDTREGHKRTAEELMVLWDGMLTPAIMNHKLISKYFNNAVKYYLINRAASPKMAGSFDSILQPYFGEITGLIDLKPGEIILSNRHRDIEIPWLNGETKTAINAFIEYKQETNKAKKKEMEEYLSWVFQRVPTDSPSGIRVLKIKGFQDVAGSGVVMHPEDMENIGGADLDIDKVYGFTRFSKAFKDDIRSTMYERYKEATYKNKKVRILKEAKDNDYFLADAAPIEKSYWGMFDSMTMYDINETATRGNRLLDPGIGSTKIMEGIADYMLNSGKQILVNRKEGKPIYLSYKDLDIEGFRDAKTALINKAADSADGIRLKSSDAVVQELWDILTKGQGGMYTKVSKDNPFMQFFPVANGVKKGKGKDLTEKEYGINQTAHNNSLAFISDNLAQMAKDYNIDMNYVPSPYFQSLYKVAELNFKKYKDLPFISSNVVAQAEKIQRMMRNEIPDFAEKIGVQKGSLDADDPFGWKALNDFKRSKLYKFVFSKSPEEAKQLYSEIFSQDMSDLTSPFLILNYVPKDYDVAILKSIHKKVDQFKEIMSKAAYDAKVNMTDQGFADIEKRLGEVDKLRLQYAEDLPEKYRNFFHAATLSSIKYQGETLGEFIKNAEKNLYAEYRKGILEIKNNSTLLPFEKDYLRSDLRAKFLTDLEKLKNNMRAEWQKTNVSDFPFRLNSVPHEIKLKFGEIYNQTVQKVNAEVPDTELLNLESYVSNKYVTEELQYPSSKRVSHDFLRLSTLIAKESLGDVPSALKKEIEDITPRFEEVLTNNPWYLAHIDAIFAGYMAEKAGLNGYGFVKTPRMSTVKDVIDFAKELIDIDDKNGKPYQVKWHHWWRNRHKVARDVAKYEGRFQKTIGLIETPEKKGPAEIIMLESSLGAVGELHNSAQIHGDAQRAIIEKDFENSWAKRLERALNNIQQGLGTRLYELAMDEHQAPLGNKSQNRIKSEIDNELRKLNTKENPTVFIKDKKEFTIRQSNVKNLTPEQAALLETAINSVANRHTDAYIKRAELTANERATFKADGTKYRIPFLNKEMTADEIMKAYIADEKIWSNKSMTEIMSNSQKVESFLKEDRPEKEKILDSYGYIKLPQLAKALYNHIKLGKPEFMSLDLIERIKHQLMLENIKLNPMAFFRQELFKRGFTLDENITYDDLIKDISYKKLIEEYEKTGSIEGADVYTNTMVGIYKNMIETKTFGKKVKDLPDRELMSRTWEYLKNFAINVDNWIEYKPIHQRIQEKAPWWNDHYHPHMSFNETALNKQLFKKILRAFEGTSTDVSQASVIAGQLKEEYLADMKAKEEYNVSEASKIPELVNMEDGISEANVRNLLLTFTSSIERNQTEPLEEWQNKIENRMSYEMLASKNYWNSISAFIGEHLATEFHNSNAMGQTTKYWTKYIKTFNQQMVNGNSIMPLINRADPNMGLKYNPYIYFTDKYWEEKIKYIERKMFNGEKLFRKYTDLSEAEIKEITSDKTKMAIAQDLYYNDASTKLAMISNLEAKYELMTLLSHPKSFVNNMLGGNLNTVSDIGIYHFKNAMNVKYLKENVFLDFNSRDDVLRFVEEMGGIEAMFTSQFGLDPIFKTEKFQQAFGRVIDYFKKGEKYSEKTVRELLKESGISEAAMNTAGWFMKESEVRLRSRAWMAHYLNVRQTLDASGYILPQDHPWLVQWANKGVAATQFLYNNANRAPFARTHLGKVFSRFQLWAWNSLAFRRGVLAQASEAGWEEGSAEFKRLQRLITADVFIFALAKAFAMSTFDNSLPPPLSYMADFGEFFFGDDKEKKKAFYGVLPYPANIVGVVAPPLTRIPFTIITALADGSLEELSARATSWFPFGRIAQSGARIVGQPEKLVQNLTGFPLDKLSGYMSKASEFTPRDYFWHTSDTQEDKKNRD